MKKFHPVDNLKQKITHHFRGIILALHHTFQREANELRDKIACVPIERYS